MWGCGCQRAATHLTSNYMAEAMRRYSSLEVESMNASNTESRLYVKLNSASSAERKQLRSS